jgi:hypothetical protein
MATASESANIASSISLAQSVAAAAFGRRNAYDSARCLQSGFHIVEDHLQIRFRNALSDHRVLTCDLTISKANMAAKSVLQGALVFPLRYGR